MDNDQKRFTRNLLRSWKEKAEGKALREVGRTASHVTTDHALAEQEIQHRLELRATFERALLRPVDERRHTRSHHPYDKFRIGDVIIRSLTDRVYPEMDQTPGISSWFRVELFDFYHNGLEVILSIEPGAVDGEG